MTVPFELDGAVAVITGAGSGIGRATALARSRPAARAWRSATSTRERAEETAALVAAAGGEAIACRRRRRAAGRPREPARPVPGAIRPRRCRDATTSACSPWARPSRCPSRPGSGCIDLNLLSIARSNLVFLPLLLEQGRGHVVNTASASGLLAYGFDRLPYVASKHAVVGVSEALAIYLGPKGIGVTCVCPSGVMTNILEQITVYGEATSPRAPQHAIVDADGRRRARRRRGDDRDVPRRDRAGDPRRAARARRGSRGLHAADDQGTAAVTRVGFVGLGSQGAPMARRIVEAGFPTTLWARRPRRSSRSPIHGWELHAGFLEEDGHDRRRPVSRRDDGGPAAPEILRWTRRTRASLRGRVEPSRLECSRPQTRQPRMRRRGGRCARDGRACLCRARERRSDRRAAERVHAAIRRVLRLAEGFPARGVGAEAVAAHP